MSKEIEKRVEQLQLIIDEAKKSQTPAELLDYVIKLYGAEFIKANDEIARLRGANDELFNIKQKVVIANRGLMNTNKDLNEQITELKRIVELARNFCVEHRDDFDMMRSSESMDVDAHFMLLCEAIFKE